MREFVEKEIMPFAFEWDEKKAMPRDMYGRRNPSLPDLQY